MLTYRRAATRPRPSWRVEEDWVSRAIVLGIWSRIAV